MRWRPSSQNQVEDRRGEWGRSGGLGGMRMGGLGGGGIPIPVGGGIGGIVIAIVIYVVLNMLGGSGLGGAIGGLGGGTTTGGGAIGTLDPGDNEAQFINAVTVDVQTFWEDTFKAAGKTYPDTVTVLFTDQTQSGCGVASSATGPFYCPSDQKVYLDAGFFDELRTRFGADGDFAHAYVIAHEFGHHVQDVLGIMDQVQQQQTSSNANDLSIRLELQADCLAGVWAHSTYERGLLERGDLEEALTAAASVGDDRIQKQATGRIAPETFTHGTAAQRSSWFHKGFDAGDATACDTFSGDI